MSINLWNDFISLIYPTNCSCCERDLYKTETSICLICETKLPKTNFHDLEENAVEKTLFGRCKYQAATAFLYFSKKGMVHRLIHELKYNDNINVGVKMGELFAKNLLKSERFKEFDYIIPVPLHKKKERKRGYNQSLKLVEGLNNIYQSTISNNILYRNTSSDSQTKKNRWQRWENVSSIFEVKNSKLLENKRVLLVDDVITTGATIEACTAALNQIKGIQVSIACLAIPRN